MVEISNKLTELSKLIEGKSFTKQEYEQIEIIGRTLNWLMDRELWGRVAIEVERLDKFLEVKNG